MVRYLHCGDTIILVCFPAPPALQKSLCERWTQYCSHQPLRVSVGNYNINGGKHFRSVAYKVMRDIDDGNDDNDMT